MYWQAEYFYQEYDDITVYNFNMGLDPLYLLFFLWSFFCSSDISYFIISFPLLIFFNLD